VAFSIAHTFSEDLSWRVRIRGQPTDVLVKCQFLSAKSTRIDEAAPVLLGVRESCSSPTSPCFTQILTHSLILNQRMPHCGQVTLPKASEKCKSRCCAIQAQAIFWQDRSSQTYWTQISSL